MSYIQLAKKYSNEVYDFGTDKGTTHCYDIVYDELFKYYKNTAKNILEIGINRGYGLLSYADYFENATIYGVDIYDMCGEMVKSHPKIELLFGDATSDSIYSLFNKEYDIIIEDASHLPEHQVKHFHDFGPKLAKGGVYVIEDIDEKYLDYVKSHIEELSTQFGYKMQLLDLRKVKGRFDDILIVVKRED